MRLKKLTLNVKKNDKQEKNEFELYPKLMEYCKSVLQIDAMRLNEKESIHKKKNKNMWLHADIVGFEDLMNQFQEKQTKECIIEYSCERSLLYSFEVKAGQITTGNLRTYFFQAVSNSSWANFSYLVAEGIDDEGTKDELQLLCESFKMGFIQLNREDPCESQVIFRAPKKELDWNMIDRIAQVKSDFCKYLEKISLTYRRHYNNDVRKAQWDSDKYSNPE